MTGPEAPDPGDDRNEGSVAWLHAMVPGAEELDLFEELDAARGLQERIKLSHVQGVAELLVGLLEGREPTPVDVVDALIRHRTWPVPAEADAAERDRPDGGAAGARSAEPGDTGTADDGGPAPGPVSPGQAAEVIAHLLGGRPVDEPEATGAADAAEDAGRRGDGGSRPSGEDAATED